MIANDPEYEVFVLLRDNWTGDSTDIPPDRISDGWYDESEDGHQVTVTHYDSTVDGETGYTSVSGDGSLQARVEGRVDVNVWVDYDTDEFNSMGEAKDLRWKAEYEVRRIIHQAANNDSTPFQAIGIYSVERKEESGDVPALFRSRIRLHTVYQQQF